MARLEQIIEILKQNPQTVTQLANFFQLRPKDIKIDIEHIHKSVKAKNLKLIIEPAYCERCNFIFKDRTKIRKPSRCPRCNSESISEPIFSIRL